MAKYVGIDLGEHEVKVVELDGSYKKPRLVSARAMQVRRPADTKEVPIVSVGNAALEAVAEAKASKEFVCAGFPMREAVLRSLTVPFNGQDQIRKVIKFEVEGAIHSHQVDDMVVDFWMQGERKGETDVTVVALPKAPLRVLLQTLERGGLEPERVELDAVALYRAAQWCGALGEANGKPKPAAKAAEAGAGESKALVEVSPVRLVVDIGAHTTRVLVARDGHLVDLRALRTGTDAVAGEVALHTGATLDVARQAVEHCLRTGDDFVVEAGAAPGAMPAPEGQPAAEGEAEGQASAEAGTAVATAQEPISYKLVLQARDRFLDRVRKELVRFLASVRGLTKVEAAFVTGGGSMMSGIDAVLEEVFGVAPRPLDVLGQLSHSLSEEEAKELGPKLATAIGLALKWLGGPPGVEMRQEDLAYTRRFDRIKFPLAIACMIGAFFLLVYCVKLYKDLDALEREYGATYIPPAEAPKAGARPQAPRLSFTGYLGRLVNPPSWFQTTLANDEYTKLMRDLSDVPVFSRIGFLKRRLEQYYKDQQKKSGFYSEFRVESGLAVLNRAAEILDQVGPQLGRYLLTDLDLVIPPQMNVPRSLTMTFALRNDARGTFREKYSALSQAFRDACGSEASPFEKVNTAGSGEVDSLKGETGGEGGYFMRLKVDLKPEIPVFHTNTRGI